MNNLFVGNRYILLLDNNELIFAIIMSHTKFSLNKVGKTRILINSWLILNADANLAPYYLSNCAGQHNNKYL